MDCKLFCYYKEGDFDDINKNLKNQYASFRIVTDDDKLNLFLKKNGFHSKTLQEMFSDYSQIMFDVYRNSKDTLLKYQNECKSVRYGNLEILNGLSHYLIEDVLLLEKARKILEDKENTVFIFKKYLPIYFAILKLSSNLGYEVDDKLMIFVFKRGKLKPLRPNESHVLLEKSSTISKYKNYFSMYSKNLSKQQSENQSISQLKIFTKSLPLIYRLSVSKFYQLSPDSSIKSILNKINKKISQLQSVEYGFFLSSHREDLLESHYQLFEKFNKINKKFQVFTIDPITSSFLTKRGLSFLDMFEETYLLANVLKHTNDGVQMNNELIQTAKKNNLSLLYLDKLNQFLLDGIYRSLATTIIFDVILKKMNLKKSIIMNGPMFAKVIATLSKKYHIPTLSIETVMVDENALSSIVYDADKICIYGLQGKETLVSLGLEKDRIVITGNPKYDYMKLNNYVNSRKMLSKIIKISNEKKLVVIAMSRWHEKDEYWFSKIIQFCNNNGYEIVIKMHPRYKRDPNISENKFRLIEESCKGLNYHFTYDIDVNILVSGADLLISDFSNVAIEGILLGTPVINVNFANEELTKFQNFHECGAAFYVKEYEQLEKKILKIFNQENFEQEIKEGRQKMVKMYNYYNDGNATQRIFELLTK